MGEWGWEEGESAAGRGPGTARGCAERVLLGGRVVVSCSSRRVGVLCGDSERFGRDGEVIFGRRGLRGAGG